MVFQLPYVKYPENGPEKDMPDYEHYRAYLHSDSIHWSYGAYTGTEADETNKEISGLDVSDMVDTLSERGYDGIYVDIRGYDAGEGNRLLEGLEVATGMEPISNRDEQYFFLLKDSD